MKGENEVNFMRKSVKEINVIKPNYCLSSKSAVGLFLFSFF